MSCSIQCARARKSSDSGGAGSPSSHSVQAQMSTTRQLGRQRPVRRISGLSRACALVVALNAMTNPLRNWGFFRVEAERELEDVTLLTASEIIVQKRSLPRWLKRLVRRRSVRPSSGSERRHLSNHAQLLRRGQSFEAPLSPARRIPTAAFDSNRRFVSSQCLDLSRAFAASVTAIRATCRASCAS